MKAELAKHRKRSAVVLGRIGTQLVSTGRGCLQDQLGHRSATNALPTHGAADPNTRLQAAPSLGPLEARSTHDHAVHDDCPGRLARWTGQTASPTPVEQAQPFRTLRGPLVARRNGRGHVVGMGILGGQLHERGEDILTNPNEFEPPDGHLRKLLVPRAEQRTRDFLATRRLRPTERVSVGPATHAGGQCRFTGRVRLVLRLGGDGLHGDSPEAAVRYAEVLAQLMAEVTIVPPLPNPRWVPWDHTDVGEWPGSRKDPRRPPALGAEPRRLQGPEPPVARSNGVDGAQLGQPLAWRPETVPVGVVSGSFAHAGPPTLAPIESSEALLMAYQDSRRRFSTAEEQRANV